MNEIFALHHISVSYERVDATGAGPAGTGTAVHAMPVLQDVDLALHEGEHIGLFGPNGCGKTTLFRCITGLVRPVSGTISLAGRPCTEEKDFVRLRQQVGFALQQAEDQIFFPTVLEDVAFGPLNLGLSQDDARDCALHCLEQLGMTAFASRLVHQLSAGEKRLVALAGILAMRPRALLLDEPTTGLDPAATARLTDVLHALPCARITVSHDWEFVQSVSDSFLTIAHCRLVPLDRGCVHTHTHIHPLGDQRHEHRLA